MIPIKKYNPAFLTDEELIDIFCVRLNEFNSIIETVKENDASVNQNVLVIGPRGSGKSTLLLRVATELKKDKKLAKNWYPIVFAEESYEISSIGEFWLECLFHLGDQQFNETGNDSLQIAHQELHSELDDKRLSTKCLAHIRDFADEYDKRLMLVVENLNMIFDSQLMNASDVGWSLRHTLQNDSRIMLLASSTSRFDAIEKSSEALFDLFRCINLKPLNTKECSTLWEKSSGKKPQKETMEAIRILTGGSSRLVSIIARFGAERSFHDLMKNLLDLVDDNTEYFKSHLELLPPQERRVYLSLADLWKPATAKEVADRSRQNSSKVSAQLKRLIQRGVVIEVKGEPRKKKYYLAERMYNIYYLLRRKRNADSMVQALISFMTAYFSKKELPELAQDFIDELTKNNETPPKIFFQALEKLCEELDDGDNKSLMLTLPDSFLNLEQLTSTFKEKALAIKIRNSIDHSTTLRFNTEEDTFEVVLSKFEKLEQSAQLFLIKHNLHSNFAISAILFNKAMYHGETDEYEEAIISLNQSITSLGDSPLIEDVSHFRGLLYDIKNSYLNIIKTEQEQLDIISILISDLSEETFPFFIKVLLIFSYSLRSKPLLKKLLESKNKQVLLPFIVAIQKELGESISDVPIEIEEVASTIISDMHKMQLEGSNFQKDLKKELRVVKKNIKHLDG
ncbi:MAG: AAA family ATPase [Cocleimonas sp.]|nr:AAA family ATPase [Cocleimonas sp.]